MGVGESLHFTQHGNDERDRQGNNYPSFSYKETALGLADRSALDHHLINQHSPDPGDPEWRETYL